MRRDDARHHHRVQVGIGHHLRVFDLLANAIAHPARARRVLPHLGQDFAGELPEVADRMRDLDLFFRARPAPGVDRVGDGILAQPRHVFLGHAEEMQRNRQRNFPQHLADQIGAAVVDEAVHVAARDLAHHVLVVAQMLRRERLHQHTPARHVGRLVLVHQGAVHRIAVRGQHGIGLGAGGGDFFQRYRRAEGDVVAKDRLHIVIARHNPVAQLGAVEHRFLLARPAHIVWRVLLVAVFKRVEGCRLVADRAAGGRTLAGPGCGVDGAAGRWRLIRAGGGGLCHGMSPGSVAMACGGSLLRQIMRSAFDRHRPMRPAFDDAQVSGCLRRCCACPEVENISPAMK